MSLKHFGVAECQIKHRTGFILSYCDLFVLVYHELYIDGNHIILMQLAYVNS